jgi:hypothetical protein
MPRTRYTVRLPPALDAAVQERLLTTRTPFAVLVREALSAYLADTTPTGTPTPADSADILREIQTRLATLTARVEVMEEELRALTTTARATTPTPADRSANTAPTGANIPPPPRRGRRPSPLRQQILDLLQRHPEDLRAEEIRVYVQARRPIGDILQGMVKGGVIAGQGRGLARRYVLVAAYEARRLGP